MVLSANNLWKAVKDAPSEKQPWTNLWQSCRNRWSDQTYSSLKHTTEHKPVNSSSSDFDQDGVSAKFETSVMDQITHLLIHEKSVWNIKTKKRESISCYKCLYPDKYFHDSHTYLKNGGSLSKLERLLHSVIDIFMSSFLQRLHGKVQNLSPKNTKTSHKTVSISSERIKKSKEGGDFDLPSSKDDPVVESEVHSTDDG